MHPFTEGQQKKIRLANKIHMDQGELLKWIIRIVLVLTVIYAYCKLF